MASVLTYFMLSISAQNLYNQEIFTIEIATYVLEGPGRYLTFDHLKLWVGNAKEVCKCAGDIKLSADNHNMRASPRLSS